MIARNRGSMELRERERDIAEARRHRGAEAHERRSAYAHDLRVWKCGSTEAQEDKSTNGQVRFDINDQEIVEASNCGKTVAHECRTTGSI